MWSKSQAWKCLSNLFYEWSAVKTCVTSVTWSQQVYKQTTKHIKVFQMMTRTVGNGIWKMRRTNWFWCHPAGILKMTRKRKPVVSFISQHPSNPWFKMCYATLLSFWRIHLSGEVFLNIPWKKKNQILRWQCKPFPGLTYQLITCSPTIFL